MPRVIVLGTGTGVGKTYVTCALSRALAAQEPNARVGALKPIETGLQSSEKDPSHAEDAAALSRVYWRANPPSLHPLFGYAEPLTPYLAARRQQLDEPELSRVRAWVEAWERAQLELDMEDGEPSKPTGRLWTLIESAGGLFSPLTSSALTNFELWQALQPCIGVLVGRDGLGTLHEITATLEAARARGQAPEYLLLSAAGRPVDRSRGTNAEVLRTLGIAEPAAVLSPGETGLEDLVQTLIRTTN